MSALDSPCKTLVKQLYQEVVQEVIENLQENFVEEGIDQDVIQELKRIWQSKILASKAVNPAHQPQTQAADNKSVPVQIVLPAQPHSNAKQNVLIVHVPAFALQSNQLYNVLSGPVITATMSLPQPLAASVLQQHMNAAFMSRQHAVIGDSMVNKAVVPTGTGCDANCFKDAMKSKLVQIQCKPSTSGMSQQNLHRNQWQGCSSSEKRESVDDDEKLHKNKKKKLETPINN